MRLLDNTDSEAQESLARFKNEAQAAGRLSHVNIVAVYDYGEVTDCAYIVMEAVHGHSLKQRLDAGERFAVAEISRIMAQILAALQFSHDRGVIHRDIKPGNVLIAEDGVVRLTDFAIARIESSVITQAGTMLGTPAYMSPEQLMAQSVDARSDVYSAGVLLYQMLTGERPFEGGLTAMARRPDDRYPSAAAFARAMHQASDTGLPSVSCGLDADETRIVRPLPSVAGPSTASLMPPPDTSSPAKLDNSMSPRTGANGDTPEQRSLTSVKPTVEHLAMALPNPMAMRDGLAALARSAHCALAQFSVSDEGRISVTGLVGADGPNTALRDAVQAAAPGASVTWG